GGEGGGGRGGGEGGGRRGGAAAEQAHGHLLAAGHGEGGGKKNPADLASVHFFAPFKSFSAQDRAGLVSYTHTLFSSVIF
ncbi:hypothetical protein HY732_01605, partial [Candidatus Uhrbacteria bacterium]|nr:hypothetical protein [Candidatus Uhrbacteria bacterium]